MLAYMALNGSNGSMPPTGLGSQRTCLSVGNLCSAGRTEQIARIRNEQPSRLDHRRSDWRRPSDRYRLCGLTGIGRAAA
jgi:hypothetical protein